MMHSLLVEGMGVQNWTYILVGVTFTIYIGIAIWTRAGSTKEFYVAGYFGINPLGFVAATVALAFGLAAASFFPAIILGIFYKKMNKEGAIAGMIVGITAMMLYMIKYRLGWFDDVVPDKSEWWLGISPEGFGTVAMVLNFIVSIIIMKFTPDPPQNVQEIVENIRIPSGAGEATH